MQTDITGVYREHSQCSDHTGFAPTHGCVLTPSILLRILAALYGAGHALCVVPVFGYSTKAQSRLGLRFVPSPAQTAQAARSLTGALSPGAVHLIPSVVPASASTPASQSGACALCLFSGASL